MTLTAEYSPPSMSISVAPQQFDPITGTPVARAYVEVEPHIEIEQTDYGAVVTVTDAQGSTQATIYNGQQGERGERGERGETGATGATGPAGPQGVRGDTGAGVAPGGDSGMVLAKASGSDYDTEWITPADPNMDYIVNLIPNSQDYSGTMDKTVAEIYEAYLANKRIIFRVWTAADTFMDVSSTMQWLPAGSDYPSFNAFIIDDGADVLIEAATGASDDGTQTDYFTVIYPLGVDLSAYRTAADQDAIDATKYVKPSAGIPRADLASGLALPAVLAADNGKFLRVVDGAWAAAAIPNASGNSFGT